MVKRCEIKECIAYPSVERIIKGKDRDGKIFDIHVKYCKQHWDEVKNNLEVKKNGKM